MKKNQTNATTRRHFIGGLAAAGTAFAIPARMLAEEASALRNQPHR